MLHARIKQSAPRTRPLDAHTTKRGRLGRWQATASFSRQALDGHTRVSTRTRGPREHKRAWISSPGSPQAAATTGAEDTNSATRERLRPAAAGAAGYFQRRSEESPLPCRKRRHRAASPRPIRLCAPHRSTPLLNCCQGPLRATHAPTFPRPSCARAPSTTISH